MAAKKKKTRRKAIKRLQLELTRDEALLLAVMLGVTSGKVEKCGYNLLSKVHKLVPEFAEWSFDEWQVEHAWRGVDYGLSVDSVLAACQRAGIR